jgi:hypothetical protein
MENCMSEVRNQFHQVAAAGFTRETGLWTLVSNTVTGAQNVEHEWSCQDPFSFGGLDSGTSTVTVENFLMGSADDSLKQKLRDALLSNPASKE